MIPDNNGGGGNPPADAPVVPAAIERPQEGVLGVRVEMPLEEEGSVAEPERGVLGERRGVQTGDTAPIFFWTVLLGGAVLTMEEVLRKKKK